MLRETYEKLVPRVDAWVQAAYATGWLDAAQRDRFATLEHANPADLFLNQQGRPLVAAFFGGTGVGKSSLLNRVAGEPLARVGVQRPTSREVTLYLHESVGLVDLPSDLPIDSVQIRRHGNAARRSIAWLDAPDFDSTETQNRETVLRWLPHIDLLIYVVSPDRYRDDVGWRVLQQRAERHAWLFVINRWDEGAASQCEDFTALLEQAGFDEPHVFCTSCVPGLVAADDFAQIEAVINELIRAHGLEVLEWNAYVARFNALHEALVDAGGPFDESAWTALRERWTAAWADLRAELGEGLEWPIRSVARRLAVREQGPWATAGQAAVSRLGQLRGGTKTAASSDSTAPPDDGDEPAGLLPEPIWDAWADDRLASFAPSIELAARHAGVPTRPVARRASATLDGAGDALRDRLTQALRSGLAARGPAWIFGFRKVTGFLMVVLPMLALGWIAQRVIVGFFTASRTGTYLDGSFAIHAALLVLVAWAAPFAIDQWLKPSVRRRAEDALRRGLEAGLAALEARLNVAWSELGRERNRLATELQELEHAAQLPTVAPAGAGDASVARTLARRTPQPSTPAAESEY